jgi:hypothetical protein
MEEIIMRTKKPTTTMFALAAGPTGHALATDISATNLRLVLQAAEAQARIRRTTMRYLPSALFVVALLLPIAALPTGDARADPVEMAAAGTDPGNWQIRRLMEPNPAELAREMAGEVVIYDSLTDNEVEAAMTAHPERIRNMMFLGTIVTDDTGEAFFDPLGSGFIREDDGC